jgi:RNA polymerase primary sigma factor
MSSKLSQAAVSGSTGTPPTRAASATKVAGRTSRTEHSAAMAKSPRPTSKKAGVRGRVAPPREANLTDSLAAYLNEASRYGRLTAQEEVELSRLAINGDDDAVETLVKHNLLLAVTIAQQFARGSLDVHNLISPANEGLIIAARKYNADENPGIRFSNYASLWCKQRLRRYVTEHAHLLKMPAYKGTMVKEVMMAKAKLECRLGRRPAEQEIADEILRMRLETLTGEEPEAKVRRLTMECTAQKVLDILQTLQDALELDAPLKDENDAATYGAYFGESTTDSGQRLDQQLGRMDMQTAIRKALSTLAERDAQILIWHFGLNNHPSLDLDQIALRLDVSRERARQLRSGALKRLHRNCGDDLKACWND